MVELMLDFMLGPLRNITDLYMNNLLYANSIVILSYFVVKFLKREKQLLSKVNSFHIYKLRGDNI